MRPTTPVASHWSLQTASVQRPARTSYQPRRLWAQNCLWTKVPPRPSRNLLNRMPLGHPYVLGPDVALHQVWSLMVLGGDRRCPANWALPGLDIWDVLLECRRGKSEEEPSKEQGEYMDWVMISDAYQAIFLNSKTFGNNQFPNNVVCTLKAFLAFLAGQGIVDPPVERHKVLHYRPTHTPNMNPHESPMNPARNPNIHDMSPCTDATHSHETGGGHVHQGWRW